MENNFFYVITFYILSWRPIYNKETHSEYVRKVTLILKENRFYLKKVRKTIKNLNDMVNYTGTYGLIILKKLEYLLITNLAHY